MSDTLKNKLKALNKDLFERLDTLEGQVAHLKDGLQNLLNEEDVRDIPSYNLLYSVYSDYLTTEFKSSKKPNDRVIADQIYSPLYAPPKSRHKANTVARKKFAEASTQQVQQEQLPKTQQPSKPKPSETYSYAVPDFSESLLDDMGSKAPKASKAQTKKAPQAQKVAPSIATKAHLGKQIIIRPKDNEMVYQVEIKGKIYLRHEKYLYDTETQLRVGVIDDTCFNITNLEPIPITSLTNIQEIEDTPYYQGDDNKVYVKVHDTIAQAVGEINDNDEIGIWE